MIESFYRDHRGVTNNRLQRSHQAFREELADALIGGHRAGQKRAGRLSDVYNSEARFQNAGSHHPSSDKSRDCALCTKKAKAACPGGLIPRGVSRYALPLGIRRPNIKCEQCNVHLCVKKDSTCWRDWHT